VAGGGVHGAPSQLSMSHEIPWSGGDFRGESVASSSFRFDRQLFL
jgi:hypothetical protein